MKEVANHRYRIWQWRTWTICEKKKKNVRGWI